MDDNHSLSYEEERARLQYTLRNISEQLEKLRAIPRYYGDDLVEQALDEIRQKQSRNLSIAQGQPFFGRLDFQELDHAHPIPLYIGKVGVKDDSSGEVVVTDWRAPVSSMFYSFTGASDEASYTSPDGIIEGIVHLKRNISIRDEEVERVVDSYVRGADNLGVADEFLLYRLEEKKDNRLRDIVSTIQAEQDNIIRAPRNKALIIQGVAGSGKTTVALHRLAYLLYQYSDRVRAEKMIIFAPNRMFLDYISDVLPELGVGGIQQTTFPDWALDILQEPLSLASTEDRLERWFDPAQTDVEDLLGLVRYKGSTEFMERIDTFLAAHEGAYVPSGDFEAWEGTVLTEATIRGWFEDEYRHYPLHLRRDRVLARISRWLEIEFKQRFAEGGGKEYKRKAQQRLKSYQKKWPNDSPVTLYAKILGSKPSTVVHLEDLAPLLYIHEHLYGRSQDHTFDHVVIDEAQDFSPFQVAVLRRHCPSQSFTILGDLAQNIFSFQGIQEWQEFLQLFDEEARGFFELKRSYRSTVEIIEFANEVLTRAQAAFTLAEPVFRSGQPVQRVQLKTGHSPSHIAAMVQRIQSSQVATVAVVTRTQAQATQLHVELQEHGIQANIITATQRDYFGGVSVMPVHLTKGLEFDAVVLVDVSNEHYPTSEQNAKLLYVGCTRALHQLWVTHGESPSQLLGAAQTHFYETGETSTPIV